MGTGILAFIDEQSGQIDQFSYDALESAIFEKVIGLSPKSSLTEMADEIFSLGADAVVIDYRLAENLPEITYNGAEFTEYLRKIRSHFPIYIYTSYPPDAMNSSEDANAVFSKDVPSELQRLFKVASHQIKNNREKISRLETRILSLRQRLSDLNDQEQIEYLMLNKELEAYFTSDYANDVEVISSFRERQRLELIERSTSIVRQIEEKLRSSN